MQRIEEIESRLELLFPEHAKVCFSARSTCPPTLFPEELVGTEKMVGGRLLEFSHGRDCARVVLGMLGVPQLAIPRGSSREPLWPQGIVGSISHTGYAAAAVAASSADLVGIGLDIEIATPLGDDLIPMICRMDEDVGSNCERAKLLFSIKEAVYKCIFPTERKFVDFLDVKVRLSDSQSRFTVTAESDRRDLGVLRQLKGACCVYNDLVLSAAWIARSE